MKRILIIGCPGSGKSTFARALARKTGLPLVHLDLLFWNPDGSTVPRDEFLHRLGEAIAKEKWIVDGNYASTLETRLQRAESVFFLDLPTETCLAGIRARRGKARADLPWIERDEDAQFMDFVRRFPDETRPDLLRMLAEHPGVETIVFHSHAEMEAYLRK